MVHQQIHEITPSVSVDNLNVPFCSQTHTNDMNKPYFINESQLVGSTRQNLFKMNEIVKSCMNDFDKIYNNSKSGKGHAVKDLGVKYEDVDLKLYYANVRSIVNKKKSVKEILDNRNIDIGMFCEINTKNPPRIKGYHPFSQISNKKFRGSCVYVANHLKGSVIRVPDESSIEMIHLIVKHTTPAIHILASYLDVEKGDNKKTAETWQHLTKKMNEITENREAFVLIGDLNRPIDADKISFGTKLLENWLDEGNAYLLNNRKTHTRYDPHTGRGSTLDLGIVSNTIKKSVTKFEVDKDRAWSPFALIKNTDGTFDKKTSDHCAIQLELKLTCIKLKSKKVPIINFRNPDGWKNYKTVSNDYAEKMIDIIECTEDINVLRIKLEILDMEIQCKAFGVSWEGVNSKKKKKKRGNSKDIKQLYQEQQEELCDMLEKGCAPKSVNAKIYKLKEIIRGPKIKPSEPMCINDPTTGELLTDEEDIKKVTLEHNVKILTKNKLRSQDIEERHEKERHHKEIMRKGDKESWELDRQLYDKVLARIQEKGKNMFNLLNKAGQGYKDAMFWYMKRIIDNEEIPNEFRKTELISIWKKKGSPLDLNMMRFIHMKIVPAKLCEALVTEKMKPKIVEHCPKIQIGGMPGSISSEHLLTLKTWMMMKETRKENGIFQVFDMEKFFDKESLVDALYTASKKANISDKSYRLWYRLNENTSISVKTSVGKTDSQTVTDSLGQGSFGAALVSSLNIGCAIEDTFKGKQSTRLGVLGLNSLILQDDISKMNDTVEEARNGCELIDETLKRKQLSVNYNKSKFLVMGSNKFRKETHKKLDNNPMKMGGVRIEHSETEKYLGDYIHEKGCVESITETIKSRTNGLTGKCEEIIEVSESPLMGGTGNSLTGIRLYEAQIIPALLNNCESWIGITETHIADLEAFQENFVKKLMRLPKSTPKAIIHWDSGLPSMKWRIAQKKLIFLKKLMAKDDKNIAKKAVENEVIFGIRGLGFECREITKQLNLPDIMINDMSKSQIKHAIKNADLEEKSKEMNESRKVGDRLSDNTMDNKYLSYMGLPMSRIWMRYRARMINGVKMNHKGSYENDLNCKFCKQNVQETQEHLEECPETEYERRGLVLSDWNGKLGFWRRMLFKIAAVAPAVPQPGATIDQISQICIVAT